MSLPTRPDQVPADTVAALRAERDFLLRSLDDLDAELAAGEITAERHRELAGRYTANAADVLRVLAAVDRPDPALVAASPRRPPTRRWAVVAALVAVAALAAVAVPRALQDRPPGATITGNAQSRPPGLDALARRVADQPDDPEARLAYARGLVAAGQLVDALKQYDQAAQLDPANPEPHAYSGWIVLLAGVTDTAMARLDRAIAADAAYPDARFFKAMALRRLDRPAEAAAELRRYLELAPADGPLRRQVEALLAELTTGTTTATAPPAAGAGR